MLDIFVNRKDSTDYTFEINPSVIQNSNYNYYGKYFAYDITSNRMYVSSYQKDTQPTIHPIEYMKICTFQQIYTSSSDS